jgi:glycosyltransferase involved in cell wall biosynthesis
LEILISFIVPAHNEQSRLPATLSAINEVCHSLTEPSEVIVVNDASTDQTGLLAAAQGARVIDVQHRHIAATRNSGGKAALGEYLFFVDADTQINAAAVQQGLAEMRKGAAGGGCLIGFTDAVPWFARLILPVALFLARKLTIVGGACLFCSRSTFETIGGFDEKYFAAEDLVSQSNWQVRRSEGAGADLCTQI